MDRPGQPAEVAPAYVRLASDEANSISGARIAVTGGKPIPQTVRDAGGEHGMRAGGPGGPRHEPGPGNLVAAAMATGVRDQRVLEAVGSTPREKFVPGDYARLAYADTPVPIPHGQVTSQPSLQALMVAALGLAGPEKVLEVGTGYGYQTALLARLAARVISIEVWADLAAQAARNLAAEGITNVTVLTGDGSQGVPGYAPFDAIIVSAAFPAVPPPLAAQLADGGRLVQPVGPGGDEEVIVYERAAGGLRRVRTLIRASFVRLYGEYGYPPET